MTVSVLQKLLTAKWGRTPQCLPKKYIHWWESSVAPTYFKPDWAKVPCAYLSPGKVGSILVMSTQQ